jgi:hypothetical protein
MHFFCFSLILSVRPITADFVPFIFIIYIVPFNALFVFFFSSFVPVITGILVSYLYLQNSFPPNSYSSLIPFLYYFFTVIFFCSQVHLSWHLLIVFPWLSDVYFTM